MFLSVEWAKRWLPAVFLLLSLSFPWWTYVMGGERRIAGISLRLSFPWVAKGGVFQGPESIYGDFVVSYNQIPYIFFVSSSIIMAGLCGLTDKSRVRTIGGLLGIVGIVSYFVLVFPESIKGRPWWMDAMGNPYFGIAHGSYRLDFLRREETVYYTDIWFLSAGFYLALAGSLMLLSPLFRTLIERLRKRL
jgi:hypothetical protein